MNDARGLTSKKAQNDIRKSVWQIQTSVPILQDGVEKMNTLEHFAITVRMQLSEASESSVDGHHILQDFIGAPFLCDIMTSATRDHRWPPGSTQDQ